MMTLIVIYNRAACVIFRSAGRGRAALLLASESIGCSEGACVYLAMWERDAETLSSLVLTGQPSRSPFPLIEKTADFPMMHISVQAATHLESRHQRAKFEKIIVAVC